MHVSRSRSGAQAVHAHREMGRDEAGQHVAGAGRRQAGVSGSHHQDPTIGIRDHRGRTLEQHDRAGGGGEVPRRLDAVGARALA